jgi:hypothetical protein
MAKSQWPVVMDKLSSSDIMVQILCSSVEEYLDG